MLLTNVISHKFLNFDITVKFEKSDEFAHKFLCAEVYDRNHTLPQLHDGLELKHALLSIKFIGETDVVRMLVRQIFYTLIRLKMRTEALYV